jgi:hypothetical protein
VPSRNADVASARIRGWWRDHRDDVAGDTDQPTVAEALMAGLISDRVLALPLPGSGCTASRFSALAALGELDLTIGRLTYFDGSRQKV